MFSTVAIIPVGGKAVRLGLPYSKSMLPQKDFDYYNPIINHCITNLHNTNVDLIVFGHGLTFAHDIKEFYPDHHHILEKLPDSDGGIELINNVADQYPAGQYIFCLPDTISTVNNYLSLLDFPGTVCGMYNISDNLRGDRLLDNGKFDIKSLKNKNNSTNVWGTIKFDRNTLIKNPIDREIGEWLNLNNFTTVDLGSMIDIGTWAGYNHYLNN